MKFAFGVLAVILFAPPIANADETTCPPVSYQDYITTYKVSASAGILIKILSHFGVSLSVQQDAKARLPTNDLQIMALVQIGIICRMYMQDSTLTTDQKAEKIMKWSTAIVGFARDKGAWNWRDYTFVDETIIPADFELILESPVIKTMIVEAGATSGRLLVPSPPPPPPKGAIVLQLFLKQNLDMVSVLKLRVLLPQFDILLGHSNVGYNYPVDTLFVDRNKVSETSVLEVLRALEKTGVSIKSIQQTHFQQPKIQVGTIIMKAKASAPFVAAFGSTAPLDIEKLASLSGNEFWKAAFNGQAWCYPHGQGVRCSISEDGRPIQ